MPAASPSVGLLRVGVDARRQHVLHRQPLSGGAAEFERGATLDADLLARQRQAEGHHVQQLAVPLPPAVHDHRIGRIVERSQVNAEHAQHRRGGGPVVDVQCHRGAVGMGQPDAVLRGQIGLRAQSRLAPVPPHGARPLGAGWDGHK